MEKEEIVEGQTLNLEEIINQNTGYLYTVIMNITNKMLSEEDIEEIISDVFFIFWKNKEKFDKNRRLTPYLVGIAKNLIKQKFRQIEFTYDLKEDAEELVDTIDINSLIEQSEKQKVIEKILDDSKEEDKNIFIMFYYNGKKIKDIAKQLKCTEVKIKSKLFRIRKRIKKELEKGGYSYE